MPDLLVSVVTPWPGGTHWKPRRRLIAVDVPLAGAATADEERTFLAIEAGAGITEWSLGWFKDKKGHIILYLFIYFSICLIIYPITIYLFIYLSKSNRIESNLI